MGTYRADYSGIGDMLTSEFMQAAMRARAEKVKARAEEIAPDAPPLGEGYKFQFKVESGVQHGKTSRAFGRVSNSSPHAFYVEYGTKNNPRHRTLGKALDAAKE